MKKKSIIIGIILTSVLVLLIMFLKVGIVYVDTLYKIKKSDTYNSNYVYVEYNVENQNAVKYRVKIPKGLGDLDLKGNLVYCFKSTKSVKELKKEFEELYCSENVKVDGEKYYYSNLNEKYEVCVYFNGGLFSDVYIESIQPLANDKSE